MTYKLFGRLLHFSFRNGVGIDLEFASSKAVWIDSKDIESSTAAFTGLVIQLPFSYVLFGRCYQVGIGDIHE
jgi:hypothetical protein